VVGDVGPGDVVGLGPVMLGHPSIHVAEVKEAGVGLRVRREAMRAILREQSGLVRSLLRNVLTRGEAMERRIAELALLSLEQRVVRALLRQAEDETVRMSHEELASRVGGSREEVTRVLSRLRRRGLVQTGRRRVTLRDRPTLERLAVPLRGLE
jgi:CRP-like cAMP-binding protein